MGIPKVEGKKFVPLKEQLMLVLQPALAVGWAAMHMGPNPDPDDIKRDDADFIAVLEDMTDAANAKDCELKIVEIPDDVEWYIDTETRAGDELVAEQHRTW